MTETSCVCRCRDSVRHFNVAVDGDQYTFGLATFHSLQEFLDHFEKQPVVAGESGENHGFCILIKLLYKSLWA